MTAVNGAGAGALLLAVLVPVGLGLHLAARADATPQAILDEIAGAPAHMEIEQPLECDLRTGFANQDTEDD